MASSSDSRSGDVNPKRVSQPFACVARASVNLGTFNLGLAQNQIEIRNFTKGTLANFRRIVAKGFEEGELHLLNLCEVGGHMQGLPAASCDPSCVTDQALNPGEYGSSATQAYMAIWQETCASQPGGVSLKPMQGPSVFELTSSPASLHQLVLTTYAVTKNASAGEGLLIVGQLHIRTPVGKNNPRTASKKRVVQ